MIALALASASLVALAGCTSSPQPGGARTGTRHVGSSASARAYLTRALDVLQAHALERNQLDWPRLRRAAERAAKGATTPAQTYPAIETTLRALRDNGHSSLVVPRAGRTEVSPGDSSRPAYKQLRRSVAYVTLPANTGPAADRDYQASGRAAVATGIRRHACGWVLDLRGNLGGDLWPMLMAVQPLLGTGPVGYFAPPGKALLSISVTPTSELDAGKPQATVQAGDVLPSVAAPVAVLTNEGTASSGEAMAIAFRGRPAARSFGSPTYGVPTGNRAFRLTDGAVLNLTVVQEADRTRHVYPVAPIDPDVQVPDGPSGAGAGPADPVLDAATAWLAKTGRCGG